MLKGKSQQLIYSDGTGSENPYEKLRINIVPTRLAVKVGHTLPRNFGLRHSIHLPTFPSVLYSGLPHTACFRWIWLLVTLGHLFQVLVVPQGLWVGQMGTATDGMDSAHRDWHPVAL